MRSHADRRLIVFRQGIPLLEIDDVVSLAGALPPARIIIILCHLHEAELFVVIGADPLGGIDGAFLQRRVDIPTCDLLRYAADLRNDGAGETANAEFETFEVFDRFDFLAEPAAHLRAGAAGWNAYAVVFFQQIVE